MADKDKLVTLEGLKTVQRLSGQMVGKMPVFIGFPNDSGVWTQVANTAYKFAAVPVSAGDAVSVRTRKNNLQIGFVKSIGPQEQGGTAVAVQPANNDAVLYPDAEDIPAGLKAKITVSNPSESLPVTGRDLIAPTGANFFYFLLERNGADVIPESVKVNGTEYLMPGLRASAESTASGTVVSDVTPLSDRPEYFGFLAERANDAVNWNINNNNLKFKVLPLLPGSTISVTANADRLTYIAAMTEYPKGNIGTVAPVSAQTDWNARKTVSSNSTLTAVAPADAKYLYIQTYNNGGDCTPVSVKIDGIEYAGTVYENLRTIRTENDSRIANTEETARETKGLVYGYDIPLTWESGTYNATAGSPLAPLARNSKKRVAGDTMRYPYPLMLETAEGDGQLSTRLLFVDTDENYVTGFGANTVPKFIPANQGFRIAVELASNGNTDISAYTDEYINARVKLHHGGIRENEPKWAALGDSITEGHFSARVWNETNQNYDIQRDVATRLTEGWAYKLAIQNEWDLKNLAIGGTGFIYWQGNNRTADNAGFRIARATNFAEYDLVTVAFGINDWKGDVPLGTIDSPYGAKGAYDAETGLYAWTGEPDTIYGGIRAVIEAVMATGPNCRLVMLTPMNALGYFNNNQYEYAGSTRYALNYPYQNSGTLEDVYQAIADVCELYGIPYIDLTHKSPVNMLNIAEALPDGIHPSIETHNAMADYLSRALYSAGSGDSSYQAIHKDVRKTIDLTNMIAKGETNMATIQRIAASGYAPEVFEIGQVLYMPWTDKTDAQNEVTYQAPVVITHIGDAEDESGTIHHNAIYMQWMYATPYGVVFDADGSNDYSSSDVHAWLNNESTGFLSGVPQDWKAAMKPVKVYTVKSNGSGSVSSTDFTSVVGKVFLPSVVQMYGTFSTSWSIPSDVRAKEGPYWEYWKTATGLTNPGNGSSSSTSEARAIPSVSNPSGSAVNVHLRSASLANLSNGYIVNAAQDGGYLNGGSPVTREYATTPCFVIY